MAPDPTTSSSPGIVWPYDPFWQPDTRPLHQQLADALAAYGGQHSAISDQSAADYSLALASPPGPGGTPNPNAFPLTRGSQELSAAFSPFQSTAEAPPSSGIDERDWNRDPRGQGATSLLTLDDGVYRPAGPRRPSLQLTADSEDESRTDQDENLDSPAVIYRVYQYNHTAQQLRQLEPNNPAGYRQFMGGPPNETDLDDLRNELEQAKSREYIRQDRPDLRDYQLPPRPTWKESEQHFSDALGPAFRPQLSFRDQEPTEYGAAGSVRPDNFRSSKLSDSIEVKNRDIQTPRGQSRLISEIRRQAINRAADLPRGTRQTVAIDARGQSISNEDLALLKERINAGTGGLIRSENIIIRTGK
jgi:hypothetical protein